MDKRIKASDEETLKSVEENWRSENLFTLSQSFEMNKIYLQKIGDCDTQKEAFKPVDLETYQ